MKTTRTTRRIAFATLAALLAGIVSACASPGAPSESEAAPSDSEAASSDIMPPAEGKTQYPMTFKTWAGEQVLEERPERIAVIGSSSSYDAVAVLGAIPVYSYTHPAAEAEWWDPEIREQVEVIEFSTAELNAESVAATNPDLIVTLNTWQEEAVIKQLMDFAPVLDYEDKPGNQEDWRKGQRLVGQALDLASAAEKAIDEADQAVADAAAANPEWKGKTVTIALDYGGEWGVEIYNVPGGYAEGFLTELGFAPIPAGDELAASPQVSEERMDLLEADVLLMGYFEKGLQEKREAKPLFAALSPVKEGRYVVLETEDTGVGATWVLRQGASAQGVMWTLNEFVNKWMSQVEFKD